MNDSGFYVWCPDGQRPTVCHNALHKAVAEAERLARNNPGKQFIVLRALGSAMTEQPGKFKPSYVDVYGDDIPF